MSIWKQLALCAVVLVVAAAAWVKFFPGAPEILASWGIEWAQAATDKAAAETTGGDRQGGGGQRNRGGPAAVITAIVTNATINDRLSAIGTGRANNSVVVTPYSSGTLTEIKVTPGSMVEAGSVIAKLDSDTEEIAVDRARFALEDAQSKLERINALKNSNTVTAVQVKDAEFVVENARLQLRDAELALQRRSIVVADRRHRRHHPGRGRQRRHQRDADRHGRRPFQDHHRFLGAGALRAARWLSARRSRRRRSPGPRTCSRAW